MANILNAKDVLVGTGRIYINNANIGGLSGDVTMTWGKEKLELKEGFPSTTFETIATSESLELAFSMKEVNLDRMRSFIPGLTLKTSTAGTDTAENEYIANVQDDRKLGLAQRGLTSATFTAKLCAKLVADAASGATVLYVDDASVFTAADNLTLLDGETTESATIAALGVDESANTLTLTTGLTNSYDVGGLVINATVTLAEGTDYYLDRLDGTIYRVPASTKVADGNALAVSYTYATYAGRGFTFGGLSETVTIPVEFWHKRRDNTYRCIKIYSAQFTADMVMAFMEAAESPMAISLSAVADTTKAAGAQFGEVMEYAAAGAPGGGW
jgi:hypothetical protein